MKKIFKIPLIGMCSVAPFAAWLGFGDQGLIHLYRTEAHRQACRDTIHKLSEENKALLEEIARLGTDKDYIESVARRQLSLVKENEVIYRLNPDLFSDSSMATMLSNSSFFFNISIDSAKNEIIRIDDDNITFHTAVTFQYNIFFSKPSTAVG